MKSNVIVKRDKNIDTRIRLSFSSLALLFFRADLLGFSDKPRQIITLYKEHFLKKKFLHWAYKKMRITKITFFVLLHFLYLSSTRLIDPTDRPYNLLPKENHTVSFYDKNISLLSANYCLIISWIRQKNNKTAGF